MLQRVGTRAPIETVSLLFCLDVSITASDWDIACALFVNSRECSERDETGVM